MEYANEIFLVNYNKCAIFHWFCAKIGVCHISFKVCHFSLIFSHFILILCHHLIGDLFDIIHQSYNKTKFVQHACSYPELLISKVWNLYASLCFESDGFGWNIKIPSSLRGERLSQIVPPFLWHCWLVAARVPVWDRPTATASCNSIAVQHFRASLFLLLFTLSYFFSLYFLSLNEFYCSWL